MEKMSPDVLSAELERKRKRPVNRGHSEDSLRTEQTDDDEAIQIRTAKRSRTAKTKRAVSPSVVSSGSDSESVAEEEEEEEEEESEEEEAVLQLPNLLRGTRSRGSQVMRFGGRF